LPASSDVVALWREHVRIVEGKGTVVLTGEGTVVNVTARGPIVLEARLSFHGTAEQRLALESYQLPPVAFRYAGEEGGSANFTWMASASANDVTCATASFGSNVTSAALRPLVTNATASALWRSDVGYPACNASGSAPPPSTKR
jgi:hypothetical protein